MRIVIIGGGAAGIMAACAAKETSPHADVILVERNPKLGRKIAASGGGRCNVTTGLDDIRAVLSRYPRGAKFLNSAMRLFPPGAVMDWFEARGVPLKVEADMRVFPKSDRGEDVVDAAESCLRGIGVDLNLGAPVRSVAKAGAVFVVQLGDGTSLEADRIVVTTGGQTFRHTGSQGDGYAFAAAFGHRITPLAPSLTSLVSRETWPADVAGLSFESVRLTIPTSNGECSVVGPILFTHKGVTGPGVFALSAVCAFEPIGPDTPLPLFIDIHPDETADNLLNRLKDQAGVHAVRQFRNAAIGLAPKSLLDVAARRLDIPWERKAAEVSRAEMLKLVAWLKAVPLTVVSRGAGDEFVTAGGVDLSEVNPSSMESKLVPGLYFAGEVLDIDGFTGGFNLQSAWCTGRLAGESAAK